jgi:hypothetical protein
LHQGSRGFGGGLKLDFISELGEPFNQSLGLGLGGATIEVSDAEVAVFGAVLEDVVDRGEDRSGDSAADLAANGIPVL